VQQDRLLRVGQKPVGIAYCLCRGVLGGCRAGEPGGVALDDVAATEAGVLEGEAAWAGELLGGEVGRWLVSER
jgi:hypothetical protein